jgi:hypothetical protein
MERPPRPQTGVFELVPPAVKQEQAVRSEGRLEAKPHAHHAALAAFSWHRLAQGQGRTTVQYYDAGSLHRAFEAKRVFFDVAGWNPAR